MTPTMVQIQIACVPLYTGKGEQSFSCKPALFQSKQMSKIRNKLKERRKMWHCVMELILSWPRTIFLNIEKYPSLFFCLSMWISARASHIPDASHWQRLWKKQLCHCCGVLLFLAFVSQAHLSFALPALHFIISWKEAHLFLSLSHFYSQGGGCLCGPP